MDFLFNESAHTGFTCTVSGRNVTPCQRHHNSKCHKNTTTWRVLGAAIKLSTARSACKPSTSNNEGWGADEGFGWRPALHGCCCCCSCGTSDIWKSTPGGYLAPGLNAESKCRFRSCLVEVGLSLLRVKAKSSTLKGFFSKSWIIHLLPF